MKILIAVLLFSSLFLLSCDNKPTWSTRYDIVRAKIVQKKTVETQETEVMRLIEFFLILESAEFSSKRQMHWVDVLREETFQNFKIGQIIEIELKRTYKDGKLYDEYSGFVEPYPPE